MFSPTIHRYIFVYGICILAGSMLFGVLPTSIPEGILLGNWVLGGHFKQKWQLLKGNKIFWALTSVFLVHLLGLINTTNFGPGLNDIRVKIPLLLMPLVFFSEKSLSKDEIKILFGVFILGVVLSTVWCTYYYYTHTITDLRKVSRFMSHIRLGLFLDIGVCVLVYYIFEDKRNSVKTIGVIIIGYLLWFILKFGLLTGLVLLILIGIAVVFYTMVKRSFKLKVAGILVLLVILCASGWFLNSEWKKNNFVDHSAANSQKQKSFSGRMYSPVGDNKQTENGFYLAYNIQFEEIYRGWPELSRVGVFETDKRGNELIWTLVRYLTSKGLTKDSFGLAQLSKEDIGNIENGITNYKYANASELRKRTKDLFSEYQSYKQGANPSGNSLLMRFEFWKAAVYIIKRNFWFGVGTGDVQAAFNKAYYRTQTKLSYEWRLRAHNQFLAITVSFGVFGLIVFVFSLIYPVIVLRKELSVLFYIFFFVSIVSFLTEDTLETISGVAFFVYFNTLFLWLAYNKQKDENQNL